jgi:hypothetical protein
VTNAYNGRDETNEFTEINSQCRHAKIIIINIDQHGDHLECKPKSHSERGTNADGFEFNLQSVRICDIAQVVRQVTERGDENNAVHAENEIRSCGSTR